MVLGFTQRRASRNKREKTSFALWCSSCRLRASVHRELLPRNQEGKMLALETDVALSASSEADREAQFEAELIGLLPFLRAFSLMVSRNRPLSEDLAQEVLAKAWKARSSYQYGTNLKAWLCTILRNEYGTHQRRAWRQVPWDAD